MIGIFVVMLITSCSQHPNAGLYEARSSEKISISKKGDVVWSSKDEVETQFIGVLGKTRLSGSRFLHIPSSHPLLRTQIEFSADEKTIRMLWGSPRPEKEMLTNKAEEFRKREDEKAIEGD